MPTLTYPSHLYPQIVTDLKPGKVPVIIRAFDAGNESRIKLSNLVTKAEVTLQYTGMSALDMSKLMQFYLACNGSLYPFTLPLALFRQYGTPRPYVQLLAKVNPSNLWRWKEDGEPSASTKINDIYEVNCSLQGTYN